MNAAVLRREWHAHAVIARQALAVRGAVGSNWLTWSLLVMGVLLAGAIGGLSGQWRNAIAFGFGAPLALILWLWWFYLIDAVRKLNHPAAFKLVPRMARRSLAVLGAVWAGSSLVLGLFIAIAAGEPVFWCWNMALFFAVSGALIRWQVNVLVVVLFGAPFVARQLGLGQLDWESFRPSATAQAIGGMMLLAGCAYAIAGALGRRNGTPVQLGQRSGGLLYNRLFRSAVARGDRTGLLMHLLGPAAHSPTQALGLMMGLAGASLIAIPLNVPSGVVVHFSIACALGVQFGFADRMAAQIYARRSEQALVRLTAGAPRADAINAVLAGAIVRQFLTWWAGSTAIALTAAYLFKVDPDALWRIAAVFPMTLMTCGTLLRGFAQRRHAGTWSKAAVVAWFVLTYAMLLTAMAGKLGPMWWGGLAVSSTAAAWMFAAARRQAMLRAPASFPAGRE